MRSLKFFIPSLFLVSFAMAQTPTWSDNIACIVYTRCAGCHNPSGIAPFSLITYNDAAAHAYSMVNALNTGIMPPWPPDQSYQRYAHERTITQEEIDLVNDWFHGGVPEGNPANAPEPPVFSNGSQLPQIDLTLNMPVYTNTAAYDDYRCFVMTTNLTEDKFITGWEVIPGNRSIVHHVLVYQDTTGEALNLDNADPGPGYTSFGGIGTNNPILIGGWVPGSSVSYMPQGMGILLRKNAVVVMQVHYPAGTSGETDSTKINMMLSDNPDIRTVRLAPVLNHLYSLTDGPLFIPANTVKTFHAEFRVPLLSDMTILSVGPHMHLIGKSIKSFAVTPAQDTIPFIHIRDWDFHWQGSYTFRQPVKIPRGSTLYAEATYDNTASNPRNPNSPPKNVALGESTTDEMLLVYFAFLAYQNGDENIVMDTAASVHTYNDCNYKLTTMNDARPESGIGIYPNPAGSSINIRNPRPEVLIAQLYDVAGKLILSQPLSPGTSQLRLFNQSAGMYFIRLVTLQGETIVSQRIVR